MAMDDESGSWNNWLPQNQSNVGDVFGDGKQWIRQDQPNNGPGAYVMWTDGGNINRNYDANGNFLNEYKGSEAFGLKDLVKGAGVIGMGMGLGGLLSAGMAGGAGAAASAPGTLSKAALDGTTAFGANSVPGAYSLGGTAAAGAGAGVASTAGGGFMSNPIVSKVLGGLGSSALSSLAGGGGGNGGLGNLAGIAAGIYDKNKQNQAADSMLNYMNTQQHKIDDVYDPNGARAKYMWEEMSRKDAAAGRNSQYGPRTTDFLGKFGGEYANATANLTRGLAGNYGAAFNQQASSGAGLNAAIGNALKGSNLSLQDIIKMVSSGSPVSNTTYNYDNWNSALNTGALPNGDELYG